VSGSRPLLSLDGAGRRRSDVEQNVVLLCSRSPPSAVASAAPPDSLIAVDFCLRGVGFVAIITEHSFDQCGQMPRAHARLHPAVGLRPDHGLLQQRNPLTWFFLRAALGMQTLDRLTTLCPSRNAPTMFEGFTFACKSRQTCCSYPVTTMDDGISPNSSREPTPCHENVFYGHAGRYAATSNSIAQLSHHFDQHTLTPRRPNVTREAPSQRARDNPQPLQSASGFSNRACRQRQSLNRLQCSSTHLSRISALVEDMVQTGLPTYNPTHPNTMLNDSTSPSLSPDEQQPPATSYFGFTPLTPPSSASPSAMRGYGPAQHSIRNPHSYKIEKELRHSASRDRMGGGQRMVQKKIRMRKSAKNLGKAVGKRRE